MKFKKDYINYLLYRAVYASNGEFKDNPHIRSIADKIISIDDVVKLTYLVGKTAGLESLFKYLLYISDKIDKSQVSIFNLKDNFEYDVRNIVKICRAIKEYNPEKAAEKIESEEILPGEETEEIESGDTAGDEEGMTLIENYESLTGEGEVFELENISETVENSESFKETENEAETGEEGEETEGDNDDIFELETLNNDVDEISEPGPGKNKTPEIEIEVIKPISSDVFNTAGKGAKEESITNEAYYNFETKFFEEVKILEKLFATVDRECRNISQEKLSERALQSLTEIIEITSELSNLSRQLMFDLIADVFHTMNLYFTKAISSPEIIESEKIKLFDSSLALVNSLIKGEDYLNYDPVVDKIEKLKKFLKGEKEEVFKEEEHKAHITEKQPEPTAVIPVPEEPEEELHEKIIQPPDANTESALFKLKYLVKEFEKSFTGLGSLTGEYGRFEALDKINELNNALRLIAKISSGLKMNDVLKLAEVTYVFLKYIKDYRMDMMEPEIQQIVKYIIFTFKMLLTNRKPDDFSVLVQHLNNPVKIFADS